MNVFFSVSASLRHQIGLGDLEEASSGQKYRIALVRGTTQGRNIWSSTRTVATSRIGGIWDSLGQRKLAGNDSSVHSGVVLRPDPCGRVCIHSQTRDLRDAKTASNSLQRYGVLTSKDTGGEGRELVATDGRITLVAEEVMNSGNERHQTLTRRLERGFVLVSTALCSVTRVAPKRQVDKHGTQNLGSTVPVVRAHKSRLFLSLVGVGQFRWKTPESS